MEQIWQITLAIIASVGGAGVIILGVVKFASSIIAERLSKKYEIKMNKELEFFKVGLDQKTYISRARFDAEFQIYRELSEKTFTMISATHWLFPTGLDTVPEDHDDRLECYLKRYETAGISINNAQKSIYANAAFILAHIFKQFDELLKLCVIQYNMYTWCGALRKASSVFDQAEQDTRRECQKRSEEIKNKCTALISQLREYLEKLDVLEGK